MRERRFVKGAQVRAKGDVAKPAIGGYGAVFNEEYVLYESPTYRLVEIIKPGAFTRALKEKQDVRCLFNHDPDNVLGRTTNDTLQLSEDSTGLQFSDDLDVRTSVAANVKAFIERGDVTGCSFAFRVQSQTWRASTDPETKMETEVREIEDVDLYDVGPVTYPAYEATSVGLRALFPEGVPPEVRSHVPGLDVLIPQGFSKRLEEELTKTVGEVRELLDTADLRTQLHTATARALKFETELRDARAAFAKEKRFYVEWMARVEVELQQASKLYRSALDEIGRRVRLSSID